MKQARSRSMKRKSSADSQIESGDQGTEEDNISKRPKPKTRREPLPMKMRAFPRSFWQQPNASGSALPTSYCPLLEEESERQSRGRVIGKANTELLFSLFRSVKGDGAQEVKQPPVVKRGRPRKAKPQRQATKTAKDEDPYFTSAIVPAIQVKEEEDMAQKQQVLAMISVAGKNESVVVDMTYSERLSDLVVNL